MLYIFILLVLFVGNIFAQDTTVNDLQNKINQLNSQIRELDKKEDTVENILNRINFEISVTEITITKTQLAINDLSKRIDDLNTQISSLDKQVTSSAGSYIRNLDQMYKYMKLTASNSEFLRFLDMKNFNKYYVQEKYRQVASKYIQGVYLNQEVILSKIKNYKDEQELLKAKKVEIKNEFEQQKSKLAGQQKEKNNILDITRKDKRYLEDLRLSAQAELGNLVKANFVGKRKVKKGDVIGLMGNSGFSTGPHLHYAVHNLSEDDYEKFSYYNDTNPYPYLEKYGWPMSDYRITQGWGKTPYSRLLYRSGIHNGIDMVSDEKSVRAVNDGVAYFYRNTGGLGNNVRVFHPDGKMTLYLHLQ